MEGDSPDDNEKARSADVPAFGMGTHPPLKVMNSLTRSKEPFIPRDPDRVTWYMCGPTVYDASHLGHARTYLCFDIVRRILEDYFGFNVILVMNVTDIDDKIIIRAAERGVDFRTLASECEADYFEDMQSLGVRLPDHVTRVSEFMPEVIEYIVKIVENGFAYESNGSVYFDVQRFGKHENHSYGKLVPEALSDDIKWQQEADGALSIGQADKRNPSDFALWKKCKPGEPFWDSPWGPGRPGWHIECSVMASKTFELYCDGCMDIHSGGTDLRFPHHDNEMAQAEAHYGCKNWVKYFLHTGHLHISGLKMSKSLKNFITIKEALETHTPRQIRILFLLHKYDDPMDYGDSTMNNAIKMERTFVEFFHAVKDILRNTKPTDTLKMNEPEIELVLRIDAAKLAIERALCDDFDTPEVMRLLKVLVRSTNIYMQNNEGRCVSLVIRQAGKLVTRILGVFGLCDAANTSTSNIGFPEGHSGQQSREEMLGPLLDAMSQFRLSVRSASQENDAVLSSCDEVRDVILPELGVRLEDKGDAAIWKLEDPAVLQLEREQKEAERRYKEAMKAKEAEVQAQKAARARVPPQDMFKNRKNPDGEPMYKDFDIDGIPTSNSSGEPLSKSALKSLRKESERQRKAYEKAMNPPTQMPNTYSSSNRIDPHKGKTTNSDI